MQVRGKALAKREGLQELILLSRETCCPLIRGPEGRTTKYKILCTKCKREKKTQPRFTQKIIICQTRVFELDILSF